MKDNESLEVQEFLTDGVTIPSMFQMDSGDARQEHEKGEKFKLHRDTREGLEESQQYCGGCSNSAFEIDAPIPQLEMKISLTLDKKDSFCPGFMKSSSWMADVEEGGRSIDMETPQPLVLRHVFPIVEEEKHEELAKQQPVNTVLEPESDDEISENKKNKLGRKNDYTQEEENLIKKLVKQFGEKNWSLIAEKIPGRNRKQVRDHYVNFLKNKVNNKSFIPEEDERLMVCVKEMGHSWKKISEKFPGRTPIMMKNRYNSLMRVKRKNLSKGNSESSSLIVSIDKFSEQEFTLDRMQSLSHLEEKSAFTPVVPQHSNIDVINAIDKARKTLSSFKFSQYL